METGRPTRLSSHRAHRESRHRGRLPRGRIPRPAFTEETMRFPFLKRAQLWGLLAGGALLSLSAAPAIAQHKGYLPPAPKPCLPAPYATPLIEAPAITPSTPSDIPPTPPTPIPDPP